MNESPSSEEDLARELRESRALIEGPESLVQAAISQWDRVPRPRQAEAPRRRLSAVLSLDSLWPGFAPATRSAEDEPRQLLFSLEEREVDLRVSRCSAAGQPGWVVSGQVLGPDESGRTLVRCGAFEASVAWSEQCEFHLEPIPDGECVVTLQTDAWEAALPGFLLPASS